MHEVILRHGSPDLLESLLTPQYEEAIDTLSSLFIIIINRHIYIYILQRYYSKKINDGKYYSKTLFPIVISNCGLIRGIKLAWGDVLVRELNSLKAEYLMELCWISNLIRRKIARSLILVKLHTTSLWDLFCRRMNCVSVS